MVNIMDCVRDGMIQVGKDCYIEGYRKAMEIAWQVTYDMAMGRIDETNPYKLLDMAYDRISSHMRDDYNRFWNEAKEVGRRLADKEIR